jgi:cyclohexanone monooxygenase
MTSFTDVVTDDEANEMVADFVRERIRERIEDPAIADELVPVGYPIASKRLCVENGYYETFNQGHVTLVNLRKSPIEKITPDGIRTRDREYELDVIIFAIGFDAGTGAILAVDVQGVDGKSLREAWKDGPKTYLGLSVSGFPNLFTVVGPGSPSVMVVVTIGIKQHVDWIADCIKAMRASGDAVIDARPEAQEAWTAHVAEVADMTVFPKGNSYYMGDNVPGKPRVALPYLGGFDIYSDRCKQVAADGYEGFELRAH